MTSPTIYKSSQLILLTDQTLGNEKLTDASKMGNLIRIIAEFERLTAIMSNEINRLNKND